MKVVVRTAIRRARGLGHDRRHRSGSALRRWADCLPGAGSPRGQRTTCTGDRPASRASFGRPLLRRHGGPTRLSDRLSYVEQPSRIWDTRTPRTSSISRSISASSELRNHNFIRMWRSESPRVSVPGRVMYVAPHPWLRTGPGAAADGKARFDLTKFDPAYFDRLRTRGPISR